MNDKKYDPKRMMTGKPSELDKLIKLIRRLIVLAVIVGFAIGASTFIPVKTAKYDTTLFNYIRYHGKPTTFDELESCLIKTYERKEDEKEKKEIDKEFKEWEDSLDEEE